MYIYDADARRAEATEAVLAAAAATTAAGATTAAAATQAMTASAVSGLSSLPADAAVKPEGGMQDSPGAGRGGSRSGLGGGGARALTRGDRRGVDTRGVELANSIHELTKSSQLVAGSLEFAKGLEFAQSNECAESDRLAQSREVAPAGRLEFAPESLEFAQLATPPAARVLRSSSRVRGCEHAAGEVGAVEELSSSSYEFARTRVEVEAHAGGTPQPAVSQDPLARSLSSAPDCTRPLTPPAGVCVCVCVCLCVCDSA
jgi:hypothetical protein